MTKKYMGVDTGTPCPVCGSRPAYVSLLGVCECSNPNCEMYSPTLYPPPDPPLVDLDDEDTPTDPRRPVYMWIHHHHDFGDI